MLIIRQTQMNTLAAASPKRGLVQPCPFARTWIEVQLLGEDGQPLPGEMFQITLPDGTLIDGRLDDAGLARVDHIAPGECHVAFPRLDRDAWCRLDAAQVGHEAQGATP